MAREGRTGVTLKDTRGSVWQDKGSVAGLTKVHLGSPIWDLKAPFKTIFLLFRFYRVRAPAAV